MVKAKLAAASGDNLMPITGRPKYVKNSCNNRGVPLKAQVYKLNIAFKGLILDIFPTATIPPRGIEKIAVMKNNSIVIKLPLSINPVMSISSDTQITS